MLLEIYVACPASANTLSAEENYTACERCTQGKEPEIHENHEEHVALFRAFEWKMRRWVCAPAVLSAHLEQKDVTSRCQTAAQQSFDSAHKTDRDAA